MDHAHKIKRQNDVRHVKEKKRKALEYIPHGRASITLPNLAFARFYASTLLPLFIFFLWQGDQSVSMMLLVLKSLPHRPLIQPVCSNIYHPRQQFNFFLQPSKNLVF
jgi:hypothetical protein